MNMLEYVYEDDSQMCRESSQSTLSRLNLIRSHRALHPGNVFLLRQEY